MVAPLRARSERRQEATSCEGGSFVSPRGLVSMGVGRLRSSPDRVGPTSDAPLGIQSERFCRQKHARSMASRCQVPAESKRVRRPLERSLFGAIAWCFPCYGGIMMRRKLGLVLLSYGVLLVGKPGTGAVDAVVSRSSPGGGLRRARLLSHLQRTV